MLEGDQPGAEVYVDADLAGTMPLDPLPLTVGDHTIRVTRPGYTEFTDVFRVRRNQTTTIGIDLMAVSMVLTVTAEPEGAQVFVDGTFAGEAPVDVDLLEGEHSIMVRRSGYREGIRSVQATPGQNETLEVTLEELPPEERPVVGTTETEWYERPTTWLIVGGAAAVLAAGIAIIVVLSTQPDSQIDLFCNHSPACVRFTEPLPAPQP